MERNKYVAAKIGEISDRLKIVEKMDKDVDLVESIIPEAYIWLDYEINVNWLVKDFDEVKVILGKFAKEGVMLKEFVKSNTTPMWYLRGYKVIIRLCPEWSKEEGASCKLVKIGEETSVYPKYKLVCDGKEIE